MAEKQEVTCSFITFDKKIGMGQNDDLYLNNKRIRCWLKSKLLESTPLHVLVDDAMLDAKLLEGVDSYAREFWREQYFCRKSEARAHPVVSLCGSTDGFIRN